MCLVLTQGVLQEDAEFQSATVIFLLVGELDQGHDARALKMAADA